MAQAHLSMSFTLEADTATMATLAERLDEQLAGQVKDLIAQALTGLEFDLQERYWLLDEQKDEESPPAKRRQWITIWRPETATFEEIEVGSADWFALIEKEQRFTYRYEGLPFTVRFEARKSRGKLYHYWRAYVSIEGKLRTKQLGKTEQLTRERLDETGLYFAGLKKNGV